MTSKFKQKKCFQCKNLFPKHYQFAFFKTKEVCRHYFTSLKNGYEELNKK